MPWWRRWARIVSIGLLLASGLMVVLKPDDAPVAIGLALAATVPDWRRAWSGAEGTALRGALVWALLAIGLGLLAQVVAWNETLESGRPWTGRMTYVMVLTILAGLISVLGARTPGGGAWAILMVLLVVVFLIPWLEGAGRLHRPQGLVPLLLDSPWTLFYGLLVLAGITNYLPTRYGLAAFCLGVGLVIEYLALTQTEWSAPMRALAWMAVAWSLALSVLTAGQIADRPAPGHDRLERAWLWFRDHWGVVWALRTRDRFNRSAELAQRPVLLTWFGTSNVGASGSDRVEVDETLRQAESTFRGLVRRFVEPERLDRLGRRDETASCHHETPGG
jgi:hypothetical protein